MKKIYKTIEKRFKDFQGKYEPIEIDWGKPQGEEKIQLHTFADYMADDFRVSPAEHEKINMHGPHFLVQNQS